MYMLQGAGLGKAGVSYVAERQSDVASPHRRSLLEDQQALYTHRPHTWSRDCLSDARSQRIIPSVAVLLVYKEINQ